MQVTDSQAAAKAELLAQQIFRRKGAETGGSGADFSGRVAVFQPPDTLRPQHDQPFAVQVEFHQSEVRAQPVVALRDPSVPGLVEAEDGFQDPEHIHVPLSLLLAT